MYSRISAGEESRELLNTVVDRQDDLMSLFAADTCGSTSMSSDSEDEGHDIPQPNLDDVYDAALEPLSHDIDELYDEEINGPYGEMPDFPPEVLDNDEEWWMQFEVREVEDADVIEDEDASLFEELVRRIDEELMIEEKQNGKYQICTNGALC
jgi:hypothetical protein